MIDEELDRAKRVLDARQSAALRDTTKQDWQRIGAIIDAHRAGVRLDQMVYRLQREINRIEAGDHRDE